MTGAEVETDIRRGRILRPARQGGAGDEEATYFGLVEDKDTGRPYPYTLTSQVDMRLHLQVTVRLIEKLNQKSNFSYARCIWLKQCFMKLE